MAQPPKRKRRWLRWTLISLAVLLLICGGSITGGILYYQARQADWLRLDGLQPPDHGLDELARVDLAKDTKLARVATDGTTVFYLTAAPQAIRLTAKPVGKGGPAWTVAGDEWFSTPADPRDARLTIVGDVLLVDVVERYQLGMLQVAVSTSDGHVLSRREAKQDHAAYAAAGDGALFYAHDVEADRSSVVERLDLHTGAAQWSYPVPDARVTLLAASVSWPGGPVQGLQPYRHVGELDEGGPANLRSSVAADPATLVFNDQLGVVHVIDGKTGKLKVKKKIQSLTWMMVTNGLVIGHFGGLTIAFDTETLTERWRVSGTALGHGLCGATTLCLTIYGSGDKQSVRPVDVKTGQALPDSSTIPALGTSSGALAYGDDNFTPVDRRVVSTSIVSTTVLRDAATWDATRLLKRTLSTKPLAVAGRFVVIEVPGPDLNQGVTVLDVESLRYTRALVYDDDSTGFEATADIAGGVAVVVTPDRRLLVLKNPL